MTTHLLRHAPDAMITAVDPDAEAMEWLAQHLPVRTLAIATSPPMPFEKDSFGLVIGAAFYRTFTLGRRIAGLRSSPE